MTFLILFHVQQSDFESTGEDGELSERLVVTLDGRQLDLDALQEIFERRRMEVGFCPLFKIEGSF